MEPPWTRRARTIPSLQSSEFGFRRDGATTTSGEPMAAMRSRQSKLVVAAGCRTGSGIRRACAHGRRHLSPLMAFGLHARSGTRLLAAASNGGRAPPLLVSASRLFHGGKWTSPAVSHRVSRRLLLTCSCAHRREAGTEATHASPTTTPVACPAPFLQCIPFRFCWHGSVA